MVPLQTFCFLRLTIIDTLLRTPYEQGYSTAWGQDNLLTNWYQCCGSEIIVLFVVSDRLEQCLDVTFQMTPAIYSAYESKAKNKINLFLNTLFRFWKASFAVPMYARFRCHLLNRLLILLRDSEIAVHPAFSFELYR